MGSEWERHTRPWEKNMLPDAMKTGGKSKKRHEKVAKLAFQEAETVSKFAKLLKLAIKNS